LIIDARIAPEAEPPMNETDGSASRRAQESFARDGFMIARGLADREWTGALADATDRDLAEPVEPVEYEADVAYPGAPAERSAPGGETVRRLLDALSRDPVFERWACSPMLTGPVRRLLGSHDIRVLRAHHNCVMTKHPRHSSATGWHQDIRYWSFDRPDLVNAWTALDIEGPDNGGMRLIPGSHRAVFAGECFDPDRFFRTDHAPNRAWIDRAVQVDLAPGDVLFFHAALLHAAGANRTDQRKRAVVFSYRAADNRPRPGTRSAARDDLEPGNASCR
jgi:phytanoyl-CoA hydroxylase